MTPKNGIVETVEPGAKDAAALVPVSPDGFPTKTRKRLWSVQDWMRTPQLLRPRNTL